MEGTFIYNPGQALYYKRVTSNGSTIYRHPINEH
jgi:hypothetical protein